MNTDLLISVLKRAAQRGATAADGYLVEESHFGASVRMREIETLRHSREQLGQQLGFATHPLDHRMCDDVWGDSPRHPRGERADAGNLPRTPRHA